MKTSLLLLALFFSGTCYSQTLELSISVPQPRLKETFEVSFSMDSLSKAIFKLDTTKFNINSYTSSGLPPSFTVSLEARQKGENEVGPFIFTFNGKKYKTNQLKFTVADSLPDGNKGLWFRKLKIDDTTVYIMIDQKQPAHNIITRKDENTISATAGVDENEKDTELIDGLENAKVDDWGSSSSTIPDFIHNEKGCRTTYKCYKVTILDKNKPLILTRHSFKNLPDDYSFKDITIN
jgi:hypothetical protein